MAIALPLLTASVERMPVFRGIDFDWTVNLGQIVIVGSFLFSIGVYVASTRGSLRGVTEHLKANSKAQEQLKDTVDKRFEKIEASFGQRLEKVETVLVKIAQQEVRLDAQDKRMDAFDKHVARLIDDMGELRRSTVFIPSPRTIEGRTS